MELNLHHLKIFYILVEEKTTYQAAKKLFISQPSVSSQVKQLEKDIGIKLFIKRGRNLVLTEFGNTLFSYAKDIFFLESQVINRIDTYKSSNRLNISSNQLGITNLFIPLMSKKINNYSDINVQIESTEKSLELLDKKLIDIAILGENVRLPLSIPEHFEKISLLKDRFCFITNSQNKLTLEIDDSTLKTQKFVGRLDGSYSQQLLEQYVKSRLNCFDLQFDVKFDSAHSAIEYALSNNVIHFTSYSLVKKLIKDGKLKEVHTTNKNDFPFDFDILAIYNKKSKKSIFDLINSFKN